MVYLAGPMRGYPEYNFPAFMSASEHLQRMGYEVFNPAQMDLNAGFDPRGGLEGFDMNQALHRNMEAILMSNAIVLLPGWRASRGCLMELAIAEFIGLPAFLYPKLNRLTEKVGVL